MITENTLVCYLTLTMNGPGVAGQKGMYSASTCMFCLTSLVVVMFASTLRLAKELQPRLFMKGITCRSERFFYMCFINYHFSPKIVKL